MTKPALLSPRDIWVLGALALLGTLWALLLSGAGASWQPPAMQASPSRNPILDITQETRPDLPPLQSYQAVWAYPLFNPGRGADAANAPEQTQAYVPPLSGYTLTGVVHGAPLAIALLKTDNGEHITARPGQTLPNGWTVKQVLERHIELSYGTQQQTLSVRTPRLPMTLPCSPNDTQQGPTTCSTASP